IQLWKQANERCAFRSTKFHHDGKTLRCVNRVGIEKQQPLSPRMPDSLVESMSLSGPACRQMLDREHPNARIALGKSTRDLGGAVGAAVVDDQDLEVRISLPAHRRQAVAEIQLFILGWNDRRDKRSARLLEAGRTGREHALAAQNDLNDEQ